MALSLTHDDLVDGLRELIVRAERAGVRDASIHIIGGAALRLLYFERPNTVDIDARIEPFDLLEPIAHEMSKERNWPPGWLNDKAARFIPAWGESAAWTLVHEDQAIRIFIASAETLLAMKLHAFQDRAGRDGNDVAKLLRITGVDSVAEAEGLYESYYPGDAFSARTVERLKGMFEVGLPGVPEAPGVPDFGGGRRGR